MSLTHVCQLTLSTPGPPGIAARARAAISHRGPLVHVVTDEPAVANGQGTSSATQELPATSICSRGITLTNQNWPLAPATAATTSESVLRSRHPIPNLCRFAIRPLPVRDLPARRSTPATKTDRHARDIYALLPSCRRPPAGTQDHRTVIADNLGRFEGHPLDRATRAAGWHRWLSEARENPLTDFRSNLQRVPSQELLPGAREQPASPPHHYQLTPKVATTTTRAARLHSLTHLAHAPRAHTRDCLALGSSRT